MARLVEWHDDYSWDAERVRFRSAIRRRSLREQLRRIPCRCQRPILVCPAKEKILKRRLDSRAPQTKYQVRGEGSWSAQLPGSARVSRVGFGVSLKRSFLKTGIAE